MMEHPEEVSTLRNRDVAFHLLKTLRLIKALFQDSRVATYKKVLFILTLAGILVALAFPDALGEAFASVVLPVIGSIIGIPIDAGLDWVVLIPLITFLFRFFPADIVMEHYQEIFGETQQ